MAKPEKFVFVCTNDRPPGHPRGSCMARNAGDILMKFAEVMEEKMLFGKYSLTQTKCIGPCFDGPIVVVFPDNVWYKKVTTEDVGEIIESHLENDKPVDRLAFTNEDWGV